MNKPKSIKGRGGEIVLYRTKDGRTALDVRLDRETIWLNLNQISALFDRDKSVVSRHLRNVFITRELDRNSAVAFFATTASDGKTYQMEYFNLDAILSVGYRVNSKRGTQFRIWATQVLRDHIIKGYTLNEKRLADNALVALTLLIAESKPVEKDTLCKVIVNLINRENT